jgi:hypothetical protein
MIIVAGGPGKHSSIVPTFGATRSVTVEMGGLEGPPKPPDARQRPGEAGALLGPPDAR